MSKPEAFEREDRYIVIKRKHLSEEQATAIDQTLEMYDVAQVPLAVVVEGDWPEYEPVWRMIEARVAGKDTSEIAQSDMSRPETLEALVEARRIASLIMSGIEDAQCRRTASESTAALIEHLDETIITITKGDGPWSMTAAATSDKAEPDTPVSGSTASKRWQIEAETIARCIQVLRGSLLIGSGSEARNQRDEDISILKTCLPENIVFPEDIAAAIPGMFDGPAGPLRDHSTSNDSTS